MNLPIAMFGPVVLLDDIDWTTAPSPPEGLMIGFAGQPLPTAAAPYLERLTTTIAPHGPGRCWVRGTSDDLAAVLAVIDRSPQAARTLDDVLRVTEQAPVADGLVVESLAYSLLLGGTEFARWRGGRPRRGVPAPDEPVRLSREDDVLHLELSVPERRNAFSRHVRDSLIEALDIAALDESVTRVVLTGAGPDFSSGGDLDEFGDATNLIAAHQVRVDRSAGRAVHRLRDRVRVVVHGACIGAGIEIPAFADRIEARPDTRFRLPEVSMGLVPGAGGTVSITRRIGRWRTAYMALSGHDIPLDVALDWGLVDART